MKFHTRYNPPPSPSFRTVGKSRTRQEFAKECDINCILAKMGAGLLAPCRAPEPVYTDLDSIPSTFEESFALINDASERFASLPSRVRAEFDNDPGKLLAFLNDKGNLEKAIDLGLVPKPAAPAAPVVSQNETKE